MKQLVRLAVYVVGLSFLFVLPGQAVAVTFSDSTFNNGDWTEQLGFVSPSATGVSFSTTQVGSGGNGGSFRQTTHNWTGPGGMNVHHMNNAAVYDPGVSGAISSIDFSFDLNWLNAPGPTNAVSYRLLLLQDGIFYTTFVSELIQQNNWISFGQNGLLTSDFGGGGPDFSASGSAIQFGYRSGNGTSGSHSLTTVSGIDNWSVTVNSASPVPEPSSMLLFGTGALALAGYARRRNLLSNVVSET